MFRKPKVNTKVESFSKKKLVKATPKKPIDKIVTNTVVYPYGSVGIVNFTSSSTVMEDAHFIAYEQLPPCKLNLQIVVDQQRKNMFAMYASAWRLIYQKGGGNGLMAANTIGTVSEYDSLTRGVQAHYLDDYLVSFREHEAMWVKNYEKIFDKLTYEFNRAANNFRGAKTVMILSPAMMLKASYVTMIIDMWFRFQIPIMDNYHTMFRFHVFTSSIPGTKASEKLAFLKQLPSKFNKILCLIADDISLSQLGVFCKTLKCKGTFDPSKIKQKDGGYIRADYKPLLEMLDVNRNPGYSRQFPCLFIPRKQASEKLVRFYSKMTNVIVY